MGKDTIKFIIKRFIFMLITLFIIITITFILMHSVPSSPFVSEKAITESTMKALNEKYGLDKSLFEQYLIYIGNACRFEFGESIKYVGWNVIDLILHGFVTSAFIGVCAAILAIIVGVTLGAIAATQRGKFFDQFILVVSTASVALPSFVVGVILLWCFSVYVPIFPTSAQSITEIGDESFNILGYFLPIVSLSIYPSAYITRLTRSSMLDALGQDYIRTAKAKGVNRFKIIAKHCLKNSLSPIISYAGPMIAYIMTGSFVVESIFSVPGVGGYFIKAIQSLDYTMIMGTTILLSVLMLTMNFIADCLYKVVDPRVQLD